MKVNARTLAVRYWRLRGHRDKIRSVDSHFPGYGKTIAVVDFGNGTAYATYHPSGGSARRTMESLCRP